MDTLIDLFKTAVYAADPCNAVKGAVTITDNILSISGKTYDLHNYDRIVVVGAGKGTAPMAQAVEDIFGKRIDDGIIVVKYGHTRPLNIIKQFEASHPIPDAAGEDAARNIIELLRKTADEKTLVICLFSGGGSALLVSPVKGITLKDKQTATELLLKSGAAIDEINTVRKHISNIKGGRLAQLACPSSIITLIVSDVIGDKLDVIASGPAVPDASTFKDAVMVIKKYGLEDKLPRSVKMVLQDGLEGKIKDTPKGKERFFANTENIIIGSIGHAIDAVVKKSYEMGLEPGIVTSELHGEAVDAARYLADRALEVLNSMGRGDKPRCLISGGETTVVVKGKGAGGRNQELALAFAMEIEGIKGITMLSAGTDGTDGPTDAAGALVDGNTIPLARSLGMRPESYLENNDSYNFFKRLDSVSNSGYHLKTGPTGTNVMDMQIISVEV